MYVKGLGETCKTLDRRLLPLLYLLLLWLQRLVKNKTVQAGNFKIVDICNGDKIQRAFFQFESARRVIQAF